MTGFRGTFLHFLTAAGKNNCLQRHGGWRRANLRNSQDFLAASLFRVLSSQERVAGQNQLHPEQGQTSYKGTLPEYNIGANIDRRDSVAESCVKPPHSKMHQRRRWRISLHRPGQPGMRKKFDLPTSQPLNA